MTELSLFIKIFKFVHGASVKPADARIMMNDGWSIENIEGAYDFYRNDFDFREGD